jgi:hypothetical protein
METPVFDAVCDLLPDKATAWDIRKRPVPRRLSDDAVLDPETAIVVTCEPVVFRGLVREWPDRDFAEDIAETMHDLDLERAAQPPVIEVTVTTPPGGIPRADLTRLVAEKVREFTGPQPVLPDEFHVEPRGRRGRVLTATRRARARIARSLPEKPPVPPSEDDTPTEEFPAITDGFELVEVHLP